MDIKKKEWRLNPPDEIVDSLAAIVRDYVKRFPRCKRDMVWEYCRTAPDLVTAIERACASLGLDGKMHNHQTRVAYAARNEFASRIIRQKREIKIISKTVYHGGTYLDRMEAAALTKGDRVLPDSRFDAVHDLLDDIKPAGIGPVTLYDVATRVCAYLDIHPTSLYVHAGVRHGLMYLCMAMPERVAPLKAVWKLERITGEQLTHWWPEFTDLPPDEVEDLLCTYRDVFPDIEKEVA